MQKYYLNDISKMYNIPESTLRYYDAKGVLLNMQRDENNYRYLGEKDIDQLKIVICLKQTGMELREIKKYLNLAAEGDSTLKIRQKMINEQYEISLRQLASIQEQVNYLEYKKRFYENLIGQNNENK